MLAKLTTEASVGIIANMDAVLVRRSKRRKNGYVTELVIWRLPEPVPGSLHRFKYRLFFGRAGHRIIGYDNERGKGDHKHIDGIEEPYGFSGLDALERDFFADIEKWRARNENADRDDQQ